MRKLNDNGFISSLAAFILTLIVCGMLYYLLILWCGIPFFNAIMPSGDFKNFILMCIYAFPLVIFFGCTIWFMRNSTRSGGGYSGYGGNYP